MLHKRNYKIGYRHCLESKIPVVKIYLLVCVKKIELRPNVLYLFVDFRLQRIGLALCMNFMILVSLENVKKYSHVVARLPQRLKSTLILAFEANSAFVLRK